MKSESGFGWVTSSSFSIRASYSTPSALSCATSSPLSLSTCLRSTISGFSRIDSTRVMRSGT